MHPQTLVRRPRFVAPTWFDPSSVPVVMVCGASFSYLSLAKKRVLIYCLLSSSDLTPQRISIFIKSEELFYILSIIFCWRYNRSFINFFYAANILYSGCFTWIMVDSIRCRAYRRLCRRTPLGRILYFLFFFLYVNFRSYYSRYFGRYQQFYLSNFMLIIELTILRTSLKFNYLLIYSFFQSRIRIQRFLQEQTL